MSLFWVELQHHDHFKGIERVNGLKALNCSNAPPESARDSLAVHAGCNGEVR